MYRKLLSVISIFILVLGTACYNSSVPFNPSIIFPVGGGKEEPEEFIAPVFLSEPSSATLRPSSVSTYGSIEIGGEFGSDGPTQEMIKDTAMAFYTWFCPLVTKFESSGNTSSDSMEYMGTAVDLEMNTDSQGNMITTGKSDDGSVFFWYSYNPAQHTFSFRQAVAYITNFNSDTNYRVHYTAGDNLEIRDDGVIHGTVFWAFAQCERGSEENMEFQYGNADFFSDGEVSGGVCLDRLAYSSTGSDNAPEGIIVEYLPDSLKDIATDSVASMDIVFDYILSEDAVKALNNDSEAIRRYNIPVYSDGDKMEFGADAMDSVGGNVSDETVLEFIGTASSEWLEEFQASWGFN